MIYGNGTLDATVGPFETGQRKAKLYGSDLTYVIFRIIIRQKLINISYVRQQVVGIIAKIHDFNDKT